MRRRFLRRSIPLVAFCVALAPDAVLAAADAGEAVEQIATSAARIELTTIDDKPVAGATVILTAMDLEGFEGRCVTGTDGRCVIEPLTYGLYRVAVLHEGEAYVGSRTVVVRPEKKEKFEIALGGFQVADEALGLRPGQPVPGLDRPAAGVARIAVRDRAAGWAWFRTGAGVATVVGGGALVVAALILASEDDSTPSVSPVQ